MCIYMYMQLHISIYVAKRPKYYMKIIEAKKGQVCVIWFECESDW